MPSKSIVISASSAKDVSLITAAVAAEVDVFSEASIVSLVDNIVEPPTVEDAFYPEEVEAREDAWSGGDNLDDPLDHAHFETGEHNTGPHVRTGGCAMIEVTRNQ